MTTRRNGGRRQLEEAVEEAVKAPFTRQIQRATIPSKCSLPVFTSIFDASSYAIQHVKAYTRSLLQWENNDAVMCKYFAAILAGEALKWFEGLPVESIGSFHHLQKVFLGQYISNNMSRPGTDTITMSELRVQEEYIALEEKQRDVESYPVAIPDVKGRNVSLLPRLTNTVASTSQGNQGRNVAEMEQKLVAMGSEDQAEFEKQHQNRGVDKIWEAAILMEDIPEPHNARDEPPPGRRSKELCVYHRFHGHTTTNCRNVRKIILRMIEQGKLNHFLAQPKNFPPPPPRGNEYKVDNGKNAHIIEVGVKAKNL
ncbi:uncharacterized protein LOC113305205 [Papaver somniferum]|uniref:uncharacterized protein LOC113305205 n=1 Tax=Papaver somniferum TaxID=3469 RepID=UPI000E6FA601|nr:uncharacterized protein LOC113305205 [Papaver somniferum]